MSASERERAELKTKGLHFALVKKGGERAQSGESKCRNMSLYGDAQRKVTLVRAVR